MKSSTFRTVVAALCLVLALVACGKKEQATTGGESTETIAPATPQPETTGTEAMTQTVSIEDSRTEAEGAALNNTPNVTTDVSGAPTATTPVTATANTPTTTR